MNETMVQFLQNFSNKVQEIPDHMDEDLSPRSRADDPDIFHSTLIKKYGDIPHTEYEKRYLSEGSAMLWALSHAKNGLDVSEMMEADPMLGRWIELMDRRYEGRVRFALMGMVLDLREGDLDLPRCRGVCANLDGFGENAWWTADEFRRAWDIEDK